MPTMKTETIHACVVTHDARGTRYRLLVVEDPQGGLQVVLPDFGWTAWADAHPGGAVHWRGMSCGVVKPSKVDLAIIGKVLDTVREAWKRS